MNIKNKLFYKITVLILTYAFLQSNSCVVASEALIGIRNKSGYSNKTIASSKLAPSVVINQLRLKELLQNLKVPLLINQTNFEFVRTNLEKDNVSPVEDIKVLILDMDDTLYTNNALKQEILKQWHDFMTLKLKEKLGISKAQAVALLEKEKQKITAEFQKAHLRKPTYTEISDRIAVDYRVSVKDWVKFKDTHINPEKYLSKNLQLINMLEYLAGKYTLALVSNNTSSQTKQTLIALGIKDYKKYFKILKTSSRKPSTLVFKYVARQLAVLSEQCISIGDSYDKDIKPALSLGMHGIHVSSYKEFIEIAAAVFVKELVATDAEGLSSFAVRGLDLQSFQLHLETSI
ncbi:MAG: HAD family hydrolase [Candidatus Omnitrophica bacterium]|nr:HAD family hydrolase [Candidatus Omnitrophota bacterium]